MSTTGSSDQEELQPVSPAETVSPSGGGSVPATTLEIRDYDLIEPIGAGGMGTVYRAVQKRLKKTVAVKILPTASKDDPDSIARFEREMVAVGRLEHPNIIAAYDAREESGIHFLVLEFADGVDLSKLSRRRGPLPIADACELIRQAAEGLQHAHENGLVHRDIKPSNLLLTTDGTLKVLDLGLALLHGESMPGEGEGLTVSGQIMGTLDYLAPEQADDTHSVDIRADIYSLGCSLFTLVMGHPPFAGETYSTPVRKITAHLNKPLPEMSAERSDVPAELTDILTRMTAKDSADRYATPG